MKKYALTVIALVIVMSLAPLASAQQVEPLSPRNLGGTNIIEDGGFETGLGWTASSADGAVVLCNTYTCDVNEKQGPNSGDGFARLGSVGAGTSASISQTVVIPKDHFSVLTFKLWLADPDLAPGLSPQGYSSQDFMRAQLDNVFVGGGSPNNIDHQFGYTTIAYDVSAYADGQPHVLSFRVNSGQYDDVPSVWLVDDVALYVTPANNIVVNGGFETANGQPSTENWKVLIGGSKVKCNKPNKTVSKEGNCALQTKPLTDFYYVVASQKIKASALAQPIVAGDILSLSDFVAAADPSTSSANSYVQINLTYADGTREKLVLPPQSTDNQNENQGEASLRATQLNYQGTVTNYLYMLISKDVAKVKVQVRVYGYSFINAPRVKLYVDDVKVLHVPRSSASAPLALPPAQ